MSDAQYTVIVEATNESLEFDCPADQPLAEALRWMIERSTLYTDPTRQRRFFDDGDIVLAHLVGTESYEWLSIEHYVGIEREWDEATILREHPVDEWNVYELLHSEVGPAIEFAMSDAAARADSFVPDPDDLPF